MTRLAEMFNVNHFIVSQVNPHVVPFLIKEEDTIAREAQQSTASLAAAPAWVHTMTHLAKGEALHRMQIMAEMGIFPNTLTKAVSVLSQKYSGDITIFPEISYADFPRMLSNPTPGFMIQAMLCGERATWPKLSRIRNHCAIELALDEAIQKLRTRVVFSSSQADLRLRTFSNSSSETKTRRSLEIARSGRARRKMSHNSELDASTIKNIRDITKGQLKDTSHRKAQSINNYTSSSGGPTNVIPPWQCLPIASNELDSVTSSIPHPRYDILSSGAETSNISTSDSDTDGSSPIDSPYSSTSPALPELWPVSYQLFPNVTLPNTPANGHHSSVMWSPVRTRNSSSHGADPSRSPVASLKALSMTPNDDTLSSAVHDSPEPKYKSLFHSAKSYLKYNAPIPSPSTTTAPNTGVKRFNALGLQLDISGTRGMVFRKKRGD